jgi:16S rRNA (guanine527-N7)-methyltransferase
MAVLAEVALPFCRVGGIVVAQKKRGIEGEIARARRAFETMGGRVIEVRDVTEVAGTEYLGEDRSLVILEKVGPTPDKYPRRPGMPAKRPI